MSTRTNDRAVVYCLAGSLLILVSCIFSVIKIHSATSIFVQSIKPLKLPTIASVPSQLEYVTVRFRTDVGSGSGVAISSTEIISNFHVIQAAQNSGGTIWADATRQDGSLDSFVATVERIDGARDLAVLSVPKGHEFKIWATLSTRQPLWGEPILAAGCAASNLPVPTQGYFTRRMPNGRWQLSLLSFFGSSGGPVFDTSGNLIAVIVSCEKPSFVNGREIFPSYIFYSVPSDWISEFLAQKIKKEEPKAEIIELNE